MAIQRFGQWQAFHRHYFRFTRPTLGYLSGLIMATYVAGLSAAENIARPVDSNSRITIENAVVHGDETTVFFLTLPDRGDPNAGKPCPLNYYSLKLKPGMPAVNIDVVAKGVCSGLLQKSRLLDNGDALMIVGDRLERWRAGEQINSQAFSAIEDASRLRVTTSNMGAQFYAISPQGDVVLALVAGGYSQSDFPDAAMVMTSLGPDSKRRWQMTLSKPNQGGFNTPKQLWAGSDGNALLYTGMLTNGLSPAEEGQLHFISAGGSKNLVALNVSGEAPDFLNMGKLSPQEAQKLLQEQGQASVEAVKHLGVDPLENGGFDVLFQLEARGDGREGFFLYRFGPDGTLRSEISLGNNIEMYGLERWFDFYIEDDQLILLSKAPVTQKIVRNVKRKWGQNIVSWIDLNTGIPVPRLIPLDERYLEAAMNAGDEGQQYLDGQPGSEPVLLTTLGGKPLVVSVGWVAKRQVVRLHEADKTLEAFTEVVDERQARLAKAASSKQRKADREASSQRINAKMAAAAGMSEEAFNALSNSEQQKALISSGNMEQLQAAMMQEAQQVQARQGISTKTAQQQQAAMPRDMNAQVATAMAQAREQMANDPNVPPAMRAQIEAMMAQMGQGTGGQNGVILSTTAIQSQAAAAQASSGGKGQPKNTLEVDSAKRGFIEYENKNGRLTTLLIFNRKTGQELLKKDYADGVIYEYIDFSRFKLPLAEIGVVYKSANGKVLEDKTPVASP